MDALTVNTRSIGPLTDDQLFQLCRDNPNIRIERKANGQLVFMTPTGGNTGALNSEINFLLKKWAIEHNLGKVFDSSTGFKLPDGSMLAPDAAWIKQDRWNQLSEEEKEKFPPLCPDFVIELRSKSDALEELHKKMQCWMDNGARSAWLIDPVDEQAFVYKPNREPVPYYSFNEQVHDEEVLPGFVLDLSKLKV